MFDAVIFDLDGTLIDTESVAIRTGRAAFAALDAPLDETVFHSLIGKDVTSGDAILRAAHPDLDLVALNRLWRSEFEAEIARNLPLKPGVFELLGLLRQPRALCTSSGRDSAQYKLGLAGLADAFAHVVTLDDVQTAKPHPEPYLLTAARLGVAPARCVVFEDSETGAAAAKAAGCVVVQVPDVLPTDGRHADHVAASLLDGARLVGLI